MIRTQRLLVLALAAVSALPAALAQPNTAAQIVLKVNVQGNETMPDEAVLARVRTRPGAIFDEQVAQADQRRLMATGRFDNVVVLRAPTEDGLIVTFAVQERAVIQAVEFRGNKKLSTKTLSKELALAAGDPLDYARAAMGRMTLEDIYHRKGYYFAHVTLNEELLDQEQRVVYTIVEGPRLRVRDIEFHFEEDRSFSRRKLRGQIQTRKAFWILSRGKLEAQQLNRDVATLRRFYQDRGFFDVQVDRELTFNPERTEANVTFIINEGPRYRIGEIAMEGNTVFADHELIGRLEMALGDYFGTLEQHRNLERLQKAYGQIGYIHAAVRPRLVYLAPDAPPPTGVDVPVDEPSAWLKLIYSMHEGDRFRLGQVTIRGNDITKDRVVRRQLGIFPGQWFNAGAMEGSEQRLAESQLFAGAKITPYGTEEDVRHALVTIDEGMTTQLMVGAGYSSNIGVLGTIDFTQRNFSWTQWPTTWGDVARGRAFRGDGQTLRMRAEPGIDFLRAQIDWREPFLFDRPVSLGVGAHAFTRKRESYDESSVGGRVSLGRLFPNRWYAELAVEPQRLRMSDLDRHAPSEVIADSGAHCTVAVGGTLVRDRTDSRWRPSTGSRLTLSGQQYMGDFTFNRLGAGLTRYWTVYVDALDRKHILAGRGQGDFILGYAPVYQRYYGGGVGGIRGFRFRGISPRTKDRWSDDPIGGDFMAYLGAEYTFPLVADTLRGVLFLDSGTVEESTKVTTWRSSAGFGIRLSVPYMGPVPMSLDFGFPLNKDDEDDTQLVSFTIGWVF